LYETRTWFFVHFGLLQMYAVKDTAVNQYSCLRVTSMFYLKGFSVNTAVMGVGATIYSHVILESTVRVVVVST
jgi:uncharacterized membrane protein YhfC